MKHMTKAEAIEFAASGRWKTMTANEITALQLSQSRCCVPFDVD